MTLTLTDHPDFRRATRRIASAPPLAKRNARHRARRRATLAFALALGVDLLLAVSIGAVIGVGGCWLLWLLS